MGDPEHDERSPLDQALDLFFYAPLGFLLNADEVIPQLIERGRNQVKMARTFGQFAVTQGQTEASKVTDLVEKQAAGLIDQLASIAGARRPRQGRPSGPSRPSPAGSPTSTASGPNGSTASPSRMVPDGPAVDSLAIPDYDSLSASQVVPRLAGLSGAELQAVGAYEAANRGRKTILNKVAQLQTS